MKNYGIEMFGRFVNETVTNAQMVSLDAVQGRIIFNSSDSRFYVCDGSNWFPCGRIHTKTIAPNATHNQTNGYKVTDIWCRTDTNAVYICTNQVTPIWIQLKSEADLIHNNIGGIQGGTSGERYHLTSAAYGAIAGTNGTPNAANRFVTNSDPRLPTADENNALAGTSGTPSSSNKYVTDDDPRVPTQGENDALAGTSGTPSSSNKYVTDDDERLIVSGLLPTGAVTPFAGSVAPSGFLICDGSAVSRTGQADLFTVIGTTYGAGDGSTTFNIPDLRGKVPIGVSGSHALASTGGEETHTLTVDEMPAHTHTYYRPLLCVASHSDNIGCGGSQTNTGSTGGDQAHNNMPPYLTLNYIIKT